MARNRGAKLFLSLATGPETRTYGDGPDALTVNLPLQARDCEREVCPQCGREHDALWAVRRVPVGTLGHFVVFRLNGAAIVPDASVPHTVDRLPRDARRVAPDDAARLWHDDSGSHVFGR